MTRLIKTLIIITALMILNSCTDVQECCPYGCVNTDALFACAMKGK